MTRISSLRAIACTAALLVSLVTQPLFAQSAPTPSQQLGRDVLREMIETNTEFSDGSTTKLAERLAARFIAAGFPAADVQIVGPDSGVDAKDKNLVVRLRGRGVRRPILLIGHLDVVEARRADWVLDPFKLTERDGYFYGRGTLDIKGGDAALIVALLRMKQEGTVPPGDIILALTAGEEGGGTGYNGADWLLTHRRSLIDAQYALNPDAGQGELHAGKPKSLDIQAAEKVFHSVHLTVRNPGGHSSLPTKDNAIYRLAAALGRVSAYEFPFRTNAVTRAYFQSSAALEPSAALARDMRAVSAGEQPDTAAAGRLAAQSIFLNAELRTTCVATLIEGGHAVNALPQRAEATVNCRVLPGEDPNAVEATLRRLVADTAVVVTSADSAKPSEPSALPAALEMQIKRAAEPVWGAVPVIPDMDTGASDGLYLRNVGIPTYGVNGLFTDPDIAEDNRAHGLNERISVKGYYDDLEFTYRLVREL